MLFSRRFWAELMMCPRWSGVVCGFWTAARWALGMPLSSYYQKADAMTFKFFAYSGLLWRKTEIFRIIVAAFPPLFRPRCDPRISPIDHVTG